LVTTWQISRSDKALDSAGRLLLQQARCILALLARNDVGVAGSQQPAHDPTGGWAVVNTARILAAKVLHGATKPFGLEEMQHELGVLGADRPVAHRVDDVAAAKDLDLHPVTRATALDQLVDELLHGEIAVAGRLWIIAPASGMALRQHEMIHPSKPGDGVANARCNARAEDSHERLIRPGGHVEFAG